MKLSLSFNTWSSRCLYKTFACERKLSVQLIKINFYTEPSREPKARVGNSIKAFKVITITLKKTKRYKKWNYFGGGENWFQETPFSSVHNWPWRIPSKELYTSETHFTSPYASLVSMKRKKVWKSIFPFLCVCHKIPFDHLKRWRKWFYKKNDDVI